MTVGIIGREEELGAIRAFLADIEHGPGALLLSGEAGIGKTSLWADGVEAAERDGAHVLECRGVEAEASLSFAGLSELLAPVFDDVAHSLHPPRRRALEIALLLVEPGEVAPDAHAIGLAVLDVIERPTAGGSAGIAVDVSELEAVRTDLQRQMDAHVRTLDQLPTAVAIFDGSQTLIFSNAAYQRLWGLDAELCRLALDSLVQAGFLRCTDAGQYLRVYDGPANARPLRMLQASGVAPRRHPAAG